MASINGITEVAHPLLIFAPIVLMLLSGYTIGKIISFLRKLNSTVFRDLVYGNIALCFLFITGFIFFGILTHESKAFFTFFTYALIASSIVGGSFLVKSAVMKFRNKPRTYDLAKTPILLSVFFFLIVLGYVAIIIYYHPIFSEYDALYLYLLISKSILLGDGVNQDFYLGSDNAMRVPPFVPSINAWIMDSFGYSSLRLFPLYFILMTSLMTYLLARSLTRDSFAGLAAAIIFLILPVTLVVSSRFSLFLDLSFIFFLTASFYFLSELVRATKIAKAKLLMLIVSLSLMILSKELGLILSIAIFFIIFAVKFTKQNQILKGLFTGLSFSPLYLLTGFDLYTSGATYTTTLRLTMLLIANAVIFVLTLYIRDQERPREILSNLKYIIPLTIPLIFISSNILTFNGPYASIILSEEYGQSLAVFRTIFGIQDENYLKLEDALSNLPRIDILFISLGLGAAFISFKIYGLSRVVKGFSSNSQYAILLILLTFLLVVWAYTLRSNYELGYIRHLIYFAPLLSVIVVIGMNGRRWFHRLYYYGVLVFASFYFLNYNVEAWSYYNHFGGFFIEPYNDPIMTSFDLVIGGALGSIVLLELRDNRLIKYIKAQSLKVYQTTSAFAALIMLGIFVFYFSGVTIAPLDTIDQVPPPKWELGVMEVVNYLNSEEEGNVLSLRAPAISFFTNRTNFDMYSPHTFAAISRILSSQDAVSFKENLKDIEVRYIVLPNERSSFYNTVENLNSIFNVTQLIESDESFEKIDIQQFSIYELDSTSQAEQINPAIRQSLL